MEAPTAVQNPGPVLEAAHLATVCGSAVFFLLMFVFVAPAVLRKVFPNYASLQVNKRIIMDDALLGQVHALIIAPLGWYIYLFTELPPRVLFFDHPLVRLGAAIELGYEFIALLLSLSLPALRQPSFIFHHALICPIAIVAMLYKCSPHARNLGFLAITSNIFLGYRLMLNGIGKGNTKLALWNLIAFAVVFFCVRIVMLGVEWWHHLYVIMQPGHFQIIPFPVFLVNIPGCLLFTILNIYWFYKICRVGWKLVFGKVKHE